METNFKIKDRRNLKSGTSQSQKTFETVSSFSPGIPCNANVHATNSVSSAGASVEHFDLVEISLIVLKLCSVRQVKLPLSLHATGSSRNRSRTPWPQARRPRCAQRGGVRLRVWKKGVCRLRRQEGQLGCDAARTWWAAEQAAELFEREAIHPSLWCRKTRGSLYQWIYISSMLTQQQPYGNVMREPLCLEVTVMNIFTSLASFSTIEYI